MVRVMAIGVLQQSYDEAALLVALRAGRSPDAVRMARAALAAGVEAVLPLRIVAAGLAQVGRFDEASGLYQRAAQLAPGNPHGWAELANCLSASGRSEAALAAWERVVALAPTAVAGWLGKARVEQGLGRIAPAETSIGRALAVVPGLPEARFALAMLRHESGRLDEAEALVAALRVEQPGRSDIAWLAARIAFERGETEAAQALLAQVLGDAGLDPQQRAETLLLMGLVLGELGRPAEAFAAAVAGKAIERRVHAGQAAGRETETARYLRLAAWFGGARAADWSAAPGSAGPIDGPIAEGSATHVFLLGFPRSGTTLLEQLLAGHPDIVALEEAPTLAAPFAEFLTSDAGCERLRTLGEAEADAWRGRYWSEVGAHGIEPTGRIFVDKAPAGTVYLPLIARLFPAAKILFAVRDPRDVVLSCLRNAFRMNAMTYAFTDLGEAANCYDACMAMAAVYRQVLPLDLIEVRHEALVDDLEAELARIMGFIGVAVVPGMTDIAATARQRVVRTPSASQVRAGLNRRGLDRWRAYAAELEPVMATLAQWVERLGYPRG